MPIHIYAEHLINIRTLTIQLTLPTDSDEKTKPTLSADGGALTLSHQGETASVTLPVRVPSDGNANLGIPTIPSRNLSFRVRIGDTGSSQHSQSGETVIPWTAASLSQQIELQCKNCCSVMVPRGKITTWKDLPSEGWAEMMEFWHCHKPNEPHNHEQQTDKKGYSAESVLAITPSVGLVNSTSFVLAAEDCDNINVHENVSDQDTSTILTCSSCNTTIGVLDATTRSYKMAKLALSISSNANVQQSFDTTKWMSCHLLNSMDNQGLRRFIITSDDRSQDPLMMWIFAPDLSISSSALQQDKPLRATKILWKPAPTQIQNVMLDKQSMTEGEIEMPSFELKALKQSLEDSAILLPQGARRFQDWNVALLSRFTAKDVEFL